MIIVISGPLPVKLPIKISPQKNFIAPKDAREDMDEIDLSGTKVPKKSATVNNSNVLQRLLPSTEILKIIGRVRNYHLRPYPNRTRMFKYNY